MKKVPYAWQIQAAAIGAVKEFISIAVDCSCGKTFAAILIALKKQMPVIVIAPTHRLCEQWKRDIEETVAGADVWVYNKPEDTKQGAYYKERFERWLTS